MSAFDILVSAWRTHSEGEGDEEHDLGRVHVAGKVVTEVVGALRAQPQDVHPGDTRHGSKRPVPGEE